MKGSPGLPQKARAAEGRTRERLFGLGWWETGTGCSSRVEDSLADSRSLRGICAQPCRPGTLPGAQWAGRSG